MTFDARKHGLRSNYTYYEMEGCKEGQRMENLFQENINKELMEKRETENCVKYMQLWAQARSKMEGQILRKSAVKFSTSEFEKRAYALKPKQSNR